MQSHHQIEIPVLQALLFSPGRIGVRHLGMHRNSSCLCILESLACIEVLRTRECLCSSMTFLPSELDGPRNQSASFFPTPRRGSSLNFVLLGLSRSTALGLGWTIFFDNLCDDLHRRPKTDLALLRSKPKLQLIRPAWFEQATPRYLHCSNLQSCALPTELRSAEGQPDFTDCHSIRLVLE